MHYNFEEDLKEADKIEVFVINKLRELYRNFGFHGFSGTKGYDAIISIGGKAYKLEIKSDYYANNTGNIVVEYECRGEPSGISTTQAHFIATAVIENSENISIYMINTKKLKKMIADKLYFDIIAGGDYKSNTKMYRFKLDVFEKYAKKIC